VHKGELPYKIKANSTQEKCTLCNARCTLNELGEVNPTAIPNELIGNIKANSTFFCFELGVYHVILTEAIRKK
jgi:hypothetical protein